MIPRAKSGRRCDSFRSPSRWARRSPPRLMPGGRLRAVHLPLAMRRTRQGAPPDWHVYWNMFPVLDQSRAAGADGCPFTCQCYREKGGYAEYRKGDCPVADDLFDRNIMVWLDPCYDEEDCRAVAAGMNKVFDAYCTEDVNGTKWV